jgi:hypothetical protein
MNTQILKKKKLKISLKKLMIMTWDGTGNQKPLIGKKFLIR